MKKQCSGLLDMTPKVQVMKQIRLCQNQNLPCFKGHYQESEKTTHGTGENNCKSYIWWGLVLKLNNKRLFNKKWAKNLNRCSSKDNIQMADKCMKRCSISLVIAKYKSNSQDIPFYVPCGGYNEKDNNKCR